MALETGTYVNSLNASNPASTDGLAQADDHIRLLKSTIKATLPNVTGAVTATQLELNLMDGVTATTAELNTTAGLTASTAELNKMDGVTSTTAELNYTDGVTSNIQTQMNTKITGVTAGAGLSGGGTSGAPTVTHADTSSQASVNNSGLTFIQDVTVDTYGHVTGVGSANVVVPQQKSFAEAYVKYSGASPTIADGYGFSSVSSPSTGITTFVFNTPQADTDYVIDSHFQGGIGTGDQRWSWWVYAKSTTGFSVYYRFVTLANINIDIWAMARRLT